MKGLIHIGENRYDAGELWELPSSTLSIQLKRVRIKCWKIKNRNSCKN